jgi:RHS repeat-associated protein
VRVNKQSFKLCIAKTKYYIYNNKPFFENRLFDAWGNLVKLTNGTGIVLTAFFITDRGYTGHEHLLSVGIINMNARLYDPLLHRFLSPDNYVQDPSNTQNFNRYGYVMNNPPALASVKLFQRHL